MDLLIPMIIGFFVLIGFIAWLAYIYRADYTAEIRKVKLRNCTIGILVCFAVIALFGSQLYNQF